MRETSPPAALPEPSPVDVPTAELFLRYLDFYRSLVARKLDGLSEEDLRRSVLPSGWTPLQLSSHLVHMERRWFRWGFAAEAVPAPWGDEDESGRWYVPEERSLADLLSALREEGRRTREIVRHSSLSEPAATGGRFAADPPTLQWILFHVLQEYARHAGQLDVVRELTDGTVGE